MLAFNSYSSHAALDGRACTCERECNVKSKPRSLNHLCMHKTTLCVIVRNLCGRNFKVTYWVMVVMPLVGEEGCILLQWEPLHVF